MTIKGSSVLVETICKSKEGSVDDGEEKKHVLSYLFLFLVFYKFYFIENVKY